MTSPLAEPGGPGYSPGTAIAALRYSIGAIGLALVVARVHGPGGFVAPLPAVQLGRGAAVGLATGARYNNARHLSARAQFDVPDMCRVSWLASSAFPSRPACHKCVRLCLQSLGERISLNLADCGCAAIKR